MKIAVTYENGQIFPHFGHTETFKMYEIENGRVTKTQILPTEGSSHGALASFLKERGTDVLICGGIGGGAQAALAEVGIRLYGGVSGNADEAVEAFVHGCLRFDPAATCSHHAHAEGEGCRAHGEAHCHTHENGTCGHGNCGH